MPDLVRVIGTIVVSAVLIVFGIIVLNDDGASEDLQKAATGWIGLVAGYWLK
jgi:hypothetical protein